MERMGDDKMALSGVGKNNDWRNMETAKNRNAAEKVAYEKTGSARELSEAEEMEAFKKEFYAELERMPKNGTIVNLAINISEKAFENMKADPAYREKILSVLQRDITSSFAPLQASLVLTVGETEKDYRGDSWSSPGNDFQFFARSHSSFYKKIGGKKDRQKELLEEYLKKRARAKKQQQELLAQQMAKAEQERGRKEKAWAGGRQMAAASSAYEASIMTDAAASGGLLLG